MDDRRAGHHTQRDAKAHHRWVSGWLGRVHVPPMYDECGTVLWFSAAACATWAMADQQATLDGDVTFEFAVYDPDPDFEVCLLAIAWEHAVWRDRLTALHTVLLMLSDVCSDSWEAWSLLRNTSSCCL